MATHFIQSSLFTAPENMYVYEGEDYSKASDSDKKSFDQLLAGKNETK